MRTQPDDLRRITHPWPQAMNGSSVAAENDEQSSYLDEGTVAVVLMQAILRLSTESRRKLLMFMHQAKEAERIAAEMDAEPDGRLKLRLTYQDR